MPKEIRWKWLEERGYNLHADKCQLAYMKSLWAPLNEVQAVFCEAKAGTGKTTLAVLAGVYEVERRKYDRIIYVRNAIPVRELGFLPGDQSEKESPYFGPLIEALDNAQVGLYEKWTQDKGVEPKIIATTTSYTRGINWDKAFVIIDEAQSFDLEEMQTVLTRCKDSCKVVVIGSLRQNDNHRIKTYAGFTPFEIFMKHFEEKPVANHALEINYRGWFSNHADNVQETIEKLIEEKE